MMRTDARAAGRDARTKRWRNLRPARSGGATRQEPAALPRIEPAPALTAAQRDVFMLLHQRREGEGARRGDGATAHPELAAGPPGSPELRLRVLSAAQGDRTLGHVGAEVADRHRGRASRFAVGPAQPGVAVVSLTCTGPGSDGDVGAVAFAVCPPCPSLVRAALVFLLSCSSVLPSYRLAVWCPCAIFNRKACRGHRPKGVGPVADVLRASLLNYGALLARVPLRSQAGRS